MASNQSSSRGGSGKSSRRGKRKPVTIDLKADAVKTEPPSGPAPSAATRPDPAPAGTPGEPARDKPGEKATGPSGAAVPGAAAAASASGSSSPPKPGAGPSRPDSAVESAAGAKSPAPSSPSATGTPGAGVTAPGPAKPAEAAGARDAAAGKAVDRDTGAALKQNLAEAAADRDPSAASGSASRPDAGPDTPSQAPGKPAKPSVTPPAPPSSRRGRGVGAMLLAALIGGVIVAGALYALLQSGQLPVGTRDDLRALEDSLENARNEIAMLETRVEELGGASADDGALADRLDAAETRIAELEGDLADAGGAQQSVDSRLSRLETSTQDDMRNLGAVARDLKATGERLDRIEALQKEVLDLRRLVETGAAGSDVSLAAMEESLSGLRDRVDALAKASSTAVTDARLSALEASTGGVDVVARRLGTLEAEVDAMANRVAQAVKSFSPEAPQIDEAINAALANLEPRLSGLSSDLGALSSRLDTIAATAQSLQSGLADLGQASSQQIEGATTELKGSIDQIDERVAGLAERLDALEAEVRSPGALDRAALAVALIRLKQAVDAAEPFDAELAAVRALVGSDTDLAPLESRAGEGVPDRDTLLARFPDVRDRIRAALAPDSAPTDPVGRVWSDLRSMVRIKSIDSGEPGAEALQKMSEAVDRSDLAAAHQAWQTLPEPARQATADWGDDVAARLAIDGLIDTVTAGVVGAISKTTN